MIKFEHDKLHVKYAFITNITSSYVYVYAGRGEDGRPVQYEDGIPGKHLDMDIKKVRIHRSVFARFRQYNRVSTFGTPRLATLNYYDDIVISIETQQYDLRLKGWGDPATWKSNFDMAVPVITDRTRSAEKQGYDVMINGEDVFWLNKFDKENYSLLNAEGNLRLYSGHAIKLFRVGVRRISTKQELAKMQSEMAEADMMTTEQEGVNVPVLTGKVLGFIPNYQAPAEEQILALSPLLEAKQIKDKTVNLEERAAYSIGNINNPTYANIEFVLQAARVIGKLYGDEANDFLDIPSILEDTGVVNLTHITESSRRNVPIARSAFDCLAWLLGYIYREKDLHKMRELNRMFRFIMNSGLVGKKDIYIDRREEAGLEKRELPLNSERVNTVLEMLRNPEFESDAVARYQMRSKIDQEIASKYEIDSDLAELDYLLDDFNEELLAS